MKLARHRLRDGPFLRAHEGRGGGEGGWAATTARPPARQELPGGFRGRGVACRERWPEQALPPQAAFGNSGGGLLSIGGPGPPANPPATRPGPRSDRTRRPRAQETGTARFAGVEGAAAPAPGVRGWRAPKKVSRSGTPTAGNSGGGGRGDAGRPGRAPRSRRATEVGGWWRPGGRKGGCTATC